MTRRTAAAWHDVRVTAPLTPPPPPHDPSPHECVAAAARRVRGSRLPDAAHGRTAGRAGRARHEDRTAGGRRRSRWPWRSAGRCSGCCGGGWRRMCRWSGMWTSRGAGSSTSRTPRGSRPSGWTERSLCSALAFGAVSAFAVFLWRRRGGVPLVVALAVGGLLGSLLAWRVGVWLGPTEDVLAAREVRGQGGDVLRAAEAGREGGVAGLVAGRAGACTWGSRRCSGLGIPSRCTGGGSQDGYGAPVAGGRVSPPPPLPSDGAWGLRPRPSA